MLINPVAVEKLAPEKSAKIKTRQEALQRIFFDHLDIFYPGISTSLRKKGVFQQSRLLPTVIANESSCPSPKFRPARQFIEALELTSEIERKRKKRFRRAIGAYRASAGSGNFLLFAHCKTGLFRLRNRAQLRRSYKEWRRFEQVRTKNECPVRSYFPKRGNWVHLRSSPGGNIASQ
jgi:hypothetical protein